MDIRKKFDADMMALYYKAKKDSGYNGTRFYQMLHEKDALEVAKNIIAYLPPTDGFTALVLASETDMSVEALALRPEYQQLFTYDELRLCKIKLGLLLTNEG